MNLDFSRLRPAELVGALGSVLVILSVFLQWFSLTDTPQRVQQNDWICGTGSTTCTAWDTFPILRFLLLAAASAPLILAWIVIRGHKLSWPPGEVTMLVGLTAAVLVGFNGVVKRPGEFGVSLSYGYVVAFLAGCTIAGAGIWRTIESGGGAKRKPPGTF